MRPEEQAELDKWAEAMPDRRKILDFLEWCEAEGVWLEDQRGRLAVSRDALLNRFFEIDPRRLEDARRALLESVRS